MPLFDTPCPRGGKHEMASLRIPNGDGHGGSTYEWGCEKCGQDSASISNEGLRRAIEQRHRDERKRVEALEDENADLKQRLAQRDRLLGLARDDTGGGAVSGGRD